MAKNIEEISSLKYTYEWVINNFNSCCLNLRSGTALKSDIFSTSDSNKNYEWQLRLYPKGNKTSAENYVSLYLINCNKKQCKIDFSLSLYVDYKTFTLRKITGHTWDFTEHHDWGYSSFIKNTDILDKNKIIIRCSITFCKSSVEQRIQDEENKQQDFDHSVQLQVLEEYESLLDDKESSDVLFSVEGKTMHAHKCILKKSSPVFSAMFRHEMKEKLENVVEIEDIRYEVFKEMLSFIYVGKSNDVDKIADELFIAANKYGLGKLKHVCEKLLSENLSADNAVKYLRLADQYSADELKSQAIEFIVSNIGEFINEPEFKLLIQVPEVLFEVTKTMATII